MNCPRVFLSQGVQNHWDFEDPAPFLGTENEKLEKFREVRDRIDARVKSWLAENTP